MPSYEGRLLLTCEDRPGIVAAVSTLLDSEGANIVQSDQYSENPDGGAFSLRMEFRLSRRGSDLERLRRRFAEIAPQFEMKWQISDAGQRKRIAIMVSRQEHCLLDLLWRWRRGDLHADIPMVVSNRRELEAEVERFSVRYEHIPVAKGRKLEAEGRLLSVLGGEYDLIVLARYMQILSGDFLERVGTPIINIHHSFLPAFPGPDPYVRARTRGVKLIGATAHYVTEEVDAGPIIEQDVARVAHRDDVEAMTRIGRDIERTVLARAVQWHLQDRVMRHGNRTVVF